MADHLESCILPAPAPSQVGCELMRELYGKCPEHDGFCASGCPAADKQELAK